MASSLGEACFRVFVSSVSLYIYLLAWVSFLKTKSHYVAQADLEFMIIPLSPSLETTGLNFFLWSPYSPVKYYSTFLTHQILGCLHFVFLFFFLDSPFTPTDARSEHPRSTSVRVCSPSQGLRSEAGTWCKCLQ